MNLSELLDDRVVRLTPEDDAIEAVLHELAAALPPVDPLARLVAAAARGTHSYRMLHPRSGAALLDLGPDSPSPMAAVACVAQGFNANGGERRFVLWVVSGLERPVVNLQLSSGIGRIHYDLDPVMLCAGQDAETSIPKAATLVTVDESLRVEHALTPLSYRIYPDTPLPEVMNLMVRRRVATVPVVGEQLEVLGIISSGDILPHVLPASEGKGEAPTESVPTARDVMTRTVLCVSEGESLIEATRKMVARGVSQLPVVREGELIGFLERKTVMRALAPAVDPQDGS